MIKVAIIGSCVTRDAFEFSDGVFDVAKKYFPRTTIPSQISPATPIPDGFLDKQTPWIKRLITLDFQKKLFDQLGSVDFDVLVIDLMSEKKDVLQTKYGYVTCSDEFVSLNKEERVTGEILKAFSSRSIEEFFKSIDLFCDKLDSVTKDKIVVIHEVYQTNRIKKKIFDRRFDRKIVQENRVINSNLSKFYRVLSDRLPNAYTIKVNPSLLVANPKHKWGLSPSHYIDKYYQAFLEELRTICRDKVF